MQRTAALVVLFTLLLAPAMQSQGVSQNPGQQALDELRSLNNAVLGIHSDLQRLPSSPATLREQAEQVIRKRSTALAKLTQLAPDAALTFALSPELLANLTTSFPEASSFLEHHETLVGKIENWVADAPSFRNHWSQTFITVGGQRIDLHFASRETASWKNGQLLQVTGVVVGNAMAVSSTVIAPTDGFTSSSTESACSEMGPQNTLVLLATATGKSVPAEVTPQAVRDAFFGLQAPSLDGFWKEASYSQTSSAGEVFGWFPLSGSYSCSTLGQMRDDAITAAIAAGVNLQNYDRLYLVVPDYGCGWAGFAAVGCTTLATPAGPFTGTFSYLNAKYMAPRSTAVALAAHEGGHQLGLLHAGTLDAGSEPLGSVVSPGTTAEYGDWFSAMGSQSLGLYAAPHRAALGWIALGVNYQVVQTPGTYTLQPIEVASSATKALKVQRGSGNDAWLWVEYRQPTGNYDSTLSSNVFAGALIHYEDSTSGGRTRLLDFTPGSFADPDSDYYDAVLKVGQHWTDPYSNLSLTVVDAGPSGLTISVSYGPEPCSQTQPTVTLSPYNPEVSAGGSIPYTISVKNNDTAGCSSSQFDLTALPPSGWAAELAAPSLTVQPGTTSSAVMTLAIPAGTPAGTFPVGIAVNGGGSNTLSSSTLTASASANCTVVQVPALAVTMSIPASVYPRRSSVPLTATVSGVPSASGAVVEFRLTKPNGAVIQKSLTASSTGTATWTYRLGPKDPIGTYTVSARASANAQTAGSAPASFQVQ